MKTILLIVLLSINIAYGDAWEGKEDIKDSGKLEIITNIRHYGALLPFKTYFGIDDGVDRPKYWNGYGVDPSGVNYWYYYEPKFNGKYECYIGYDKVWEGTTICEDKIVDKPSHKTIDEPNPWVLLIIGLICLVLSKNT